MRLAPASIEAPRAKAAPDRASALRRAGAVAIYLAGVSILGAAYPAIHEGSALLGAEWQNAWALYGLLLVPWLLWRGTYGEDQRRPRLLLGTVQGFAHGPRGTRVWLRDLPGVLRAVGFALLVLALGRPLNLATPTSSEREGIDVVLVLDLSGSMKAVIENFPEPLARLSSPAADGLRPTRLDAAKAVIRDFLSRRKNDRIGIVVFGKEAYVLCPPTLDYALLDTMVQRLRLDLIDPSRTAIGNGIGVAVARLRRSQASSKAIILLTDGDNNAGEVAPEYAAHLATVVGARVYTVQIGAGEKAEVHEGFDLFGQPRYATRFFPVNAALLERISASTGGTSYVASDAAALQASFHDLLDRLEKSTFESDVATFEDMYRSFLVPGVLLIALDVLLRSLVLRRFP